MRSAFAEVCAPHGASSAVGVRAVSMRGEEHTIWLQETAKHGSGQGTGIPWCALRSFHCTPTRRRWPLVESLEYLSTMFLVVGRTNSHGLACWESPENCRLRIFRTSVHLEKFKKCVRTKNCADVPNTFPKLSLSVQTFRKSLCTFFYAIARK